MKGLKKMGGQNSSNDLFTHGGTGTSKCVIGTRLLRPLFSLMGTDTNKCGTGTKLLLPCFSALVPIPIIVVPVPLSKNFKNSLHFGFHCTLTSCTTSNSLQTDLCLLNCVLHSLSTFTLTLESSLLHVIKSPKVQI